MKLIKTIIFLLYLGLSAMSQAANTLSYIRLLTAKDGNSYFTTEQEVLNPAKVGFISRMIPVSNVFFGHGSGKEQDWHNPAQKLFIIVLSGIMQIETSKGEIKNFSAGEILLLEDLTGKGHKTRSLTGQTVSYLAIPLIE